MTHYIPILKQSKLFAGISDEEILQMLPCLNTSVQHLAKGDFLFRQGDKLHVIAMPVRGSLLIQRDDYWGNRHILRPIGVGELFGEAYVAPDSGFLQSDVIAAEETVVLRFEAARLLTTCTCACRFHTAVVQNLFYAVSEKNRALVQKLGYMSERTTRGKLIAYLSEESGRQQRSLFTIPFNRQQLADYLSVDRSAMSAELCRMRDDGLLRFKKNQFELL